ncbi:MAG: hypothetical protein ACI9ON_001716 [Limisphaerales bacterium]|jgi:hypothetical protein
MEAQHHKLLLKPFLWVFVLVLLSNAPQVMAAESPFIRIVDETPAGFSNLGEKQTTQADIYYGSVFLANAFIEFDLYEIEILDPISVLEAIPNLKDPGRLADILTGPRPTNAQMLCNSRVREGCGHVQTDEVDLLFDESQFRVDIFVSRDELLLHHLQQEKYLPASNVDQSYLHNVRVNVSGTGSESRYNVSSESFFATGDSRLRARYAMSDAGFSLYEMSWQKDDQDTEYEFGSFRTLGRNIAFTSDLEVLGVRIASSTKRRVDLDQALGTPVMLFLPERSRVDVYRGRELVHSRYYETGNQQIDTSGFPDGAYEISLKVTGHSGNEVEETQFFVRSGMMPPKGEPQYYIEAGSLMDSTQPGLPELRGDWWMRGGASHRLRDNLSTDNEFIFAGNQGVWQSGLFVLHQNWHAYGGMMLSSDQDYGYSLRSGMRFGEVSASVDYREVRTSLKSGSNPDLNLNPSVSATTTDQYDLFPESYRQGSATLAFPLWKGRFFLRGRVNQRRHTQEKSVGFSFWAPLMQIGMLQANFSLDGNYSQERSWIQAGVQIRWSRKHESAAISPSLQYNDDIQQGNGSDFLANGRWNGRDKLPYVGEADRSLYLNHDPQRSNLGVRFAPRDFPLSDVEFGVQKNDRAADVYYAMNNEFSVVSADGKTTFGDGGSAAGAVLIHIKGEVSGKFQVLVNNRVAGYVWAGTPNVISLRPYETYKVHIAPVGDQIVGYDEGVQTITLYPGNVETLEFNARELTVLVGQAVDVEGQPIAHYRFQNVEGIGSTDVLGWFQVELSSRDSLLLENSAGDKCQMVLPELDVEQGLAVVESLTCVPTPGRL